MKIRTRYSECNRKGEQETVFGSYLRVDTVFQKAAGEWAEGIQGERDAVSRRPTINRVISSYNKTN